MVEQRMPDADAYLAGWNAGFETARVIGLILEHYAVARPDLESIAADEARCYMEDAMEREDLTWRRGVRLFFSYFDGYLDGLRLKAAVQAQAPRARVEEIA